MDQYLRMTCPNCGKELKASLASAGKRAKCPRKTCNAVFQVPGLPTVPQPSNNVPMDLDFLATSAPPTSQSPVRSSYRNDEPVEGESREKRIPWTIVSVIGGLALVVLLVSGV